MKKILAICMSVLLICAAMPFAFATADAESTIVVSDVEGKAGEAVQVTVSMKNNPGITSTKVKVYFDSSVLALTGKANGDFVATGYSYGEHADYIVINWCDMVSGTNCTAELLATLTFQIKDDAAAGTYPLTIEYDNEGDIYNYDWDTVIFGADEGSITVVEDAPVAPEYTEPTIVVSEAEGKAGDTVNVTVSMVKNPGITSTKIKVYFDNSVLALTGKANGDFVATGYSYGEHADYIVINWCDMVTGTNCTAELLATLTFQIKDDAAAGTYPLTIEYDNEGDIYNYDWDTVIFAADEGAITVIGNEPSEPECTEHSYESDCDPICDVCGESRPVHTEGIVHFDAVDAGCHYIGNIEYWFCPECECYWADEALTQLTNSKNVIVPAKGGDVVHIDAVAPGCHYIGNIEYWYCAECEQFWQDEALTQLTNSKNVILPAIGGEVEHVKAVEPTCSSEGNIEYWFCAECEQYWQDEALTQLTNSKNVKIGTTDHNLVHFDAVESGCHYIGNIEYWFCVDCEAVWQDAALTQLTNLKNVITPAKGGDVVHFDAVAPGCHYIGNIEYWYCAECEQFWQDEALTQLTNSKNVILPAVGSDNLQHVDAVEPTCDTAGNIEYWFCPDCEQYWQDEALTQLTNSKNVILPSIEHANLVHMDAVAPGCHYIGNIEYWVCYDCETVWQDAALTQITNIKNVILPALKDTADYVAAKDATCSAEGNVEYWFCAECEQVWVDEALTQLSNLKNVIIGKVDHTYDYPCDPDCNVCGENREIGDSHNIVHKDAVAPTCTENGNIEYWYCSNCGMAWLDEACTLNTNLKAVVLGRTCATNAVHNEGVEAGCHYTGVVENWYCANCDVYYLDAACTVITNYLSTIIPAKGGDVTHIDAVAPGCHYIGNIEYWYCPECEQFWQDEALTQLTNSKNVILPALESTATYVPAVDATCESEGNVEYWFCDKCEQVWVDEALTQLSNLKNVKIGVLDHNIVHMDAVEPGCHYNGNIEYWFCSNCNAYWQDEALTQVTNSKNVILPAKGGDVVHIDAVAPGCHYIGNIEYWYCPECEQFWQDEALTQLTNSKNVILPALESTATHVPAKAPTCDTFGNVEYWTCEKCEQVWVDEALTQLSNYKNVQIAPAHTNLVHMEAVEAACHYNGNVEYWVCYDCGAVYTDEALTQLSNIKNVIIPAIGGDVIAFEAIEPGCHYNGRIAYWYCAECDQFWADEALTQVTNSKNVILPATGSENLKHVEYKAPTATEDGNIEYWYCSDCEQFWADEALTQLTNSKNVIIPATGEEPDSPATGDSVVGVVVALLTLIASAVAVFVLKNKKRA